MQTILTRYSPSFTHHAPKMRATTNVHRARSYSIDWDDALSLEENHRAAAANLLAKMEWDTQSHLHIDQFVSGPLDRGGDNFAHIHTAPRP